MEKNVGLHGGVQVETTDPGSFVEEISTRNLAIGALYRRVANDQFDHIHLLDNVLESADIGIGNLAAGGDVAESRKVLKEIVGQLMGGSLADDALELFRLDESILVLVEVYKGLSDTLSLQPTQHLCELRIGHNVSLVLGANVQGRPVSLPVEREAIFALVRPPCLVELVEIDVARAVSVEEAEDDFILGVWLRKQVLEDSPVLEGHFALLIAVCDVEKNTVLEALDFVLEDACGQLGWVRHVSERYIHVVFALGGNCVNEVLLVQIIFVGFVFGGVSKEGLTHDPSELWGIGGAQEHLAHLLRYGRHDARGRYTGVQVSMAANDGRGVGVRTRKDRGSEGLSV